MSFLTKLGLILAKVGSVAAELAGLPSLQALLSPRVAAVEGKVVSELGSIGALVSVVEGVFTAMGNQTGSGAQKLAAIVPQVAKVIQASELVASRKLKDETLFTKGVTDITSGVAEVLNSLE